MTFDPSPANATEQLVEAYEVKFLLPADRADGVEAWARRHLPPDSHGDGGRYQTTSLYCDTDALDVYHRSPGFKRSKHRLRRYGDSALIFLERKKRKGDRVRKKRVEVHGEHLAFFEADDVSPDWAGAWFFEQLRTRDLRPRCRIAYTRTAFVGHSYTGPIRLTIDRDVTGVPASLWEVPPVEGGKPLLPGSAILELKYQTVLPLAFRELLAELPTGGGGVSKYRHCIEACGLTGGSNGWHSTG